MSIKIEVGKKYLSRCGDTWCVTEKDGWRFVATSGMRSSSFTANGFYYSDVEDDEDDLIHLVVDEPKEIQHLDVIIAMAQKKKVQYLSYIGEWEDLPVESTRNPIDDSTWKWRVKPEKVVRTIMIGDVCVNAPENEPPAHGTTYFLNRLDVITNYRWLGDNSDHMWLKSGLVFLSGADAIAASDAIKKLLSGK